MNRLEFMNKLESLLYDVTPEERAEALQYYNDYLNDAGVENEQEVLESLGSPEKVANNIKEGQSESGRAAEYTEGGYRNPYTNEPKNELVDRKEKKSMSSGMLVVIILICVLASPFIVTIATGLFGAGFGVLAGILGALLAVCFSGIILFGIAVFFIGLGAGELFSIPLAGMCLIGVGILILGISIFLIWLTVWFCGKAIPAVIRAIVNLFSSLFHKKGGAQV